MNVYRLGFLTAFLFSLVSCSGGSDVQVVVPPKDDPVATPGPTPSPSASPSVADAPAMVRRLGRGVSLYGMVSGPSEGSGGTILTDEYFDRAKEGGFATVQLITRFSNHAAAQAPYALDEAFMRRIDYAVSAATSRGLNIVLLMGGYNQLVGNALEPGEYAVPDAAVQDRFVAMWAQIAERYKTASVDKVAFHLGVPSGKLTAPVWSALIGRTVPQIRKADPNRYLIVSGPDQGSAYALNQLSLPDDQRLIVGIQSFYPNEFVFQGLPFVAGSDQWLGKTCCDTDTQNAIKSGFDTALNWSAGRRSFYLYGFGSSVKAPQDSRAAYARVNRNEAERRGIAWAYWEFALDFGVWNPSTKQWYPEVRNGLTGP